MFDLAANYSEAGESRFLPMNSDYNPVEYVARASELYGHAQLYESPDLTQRRTETGNDNQNYERINQFSPQTLSARQAVEEVKYAEALQ